MLPKKKSSLARSTTLLILTCALLGGALVWRDYKLGRLAQSEPNFVRSSERPRDKERVPISDDVRRKAGLFTTHSYCRMTRWLWTTRYTPGTRRVMKECHPKVQYPVWGRMLHNSTDQLVKAEQLRDRDTVFVPITAIETFVERILPSLTVSIVVISGQTWIVPPAKESAIQSLVRNPKIIRWFCQNLSVYGGSDPRHPKISPFPCEFSYLMPHTKINPFRNLTACIRIRWPGRHRMVYGQRIQMVQGGVSRNPSQSVCNRKVGM